MAKFVKLGGRFVNVDQITHVDIQQAGGRFEASEHKAQIYFVGGGGAYLPVSAADWPQLEKALDS
jgi:hypothetical protein